MARLQKRVVNDVHMLRETGSCSGLGKITVGILRVVNQAKHPTLCWITFPTALKMIGC